MRSLSLLLAACLLLPALGCNSIADMAHSEGGQRVYGGTRRNVAWIQGEELVTHTGGAEVIFGIVDFPLSLGLDTAFLPVTLIFALVRANQWSLDR
jgi:uncharacterized protein YceK